MSKKNKESELDEKDIIAQEADEDLGYVLPGELKPHEHKADE